MVSEGKVNIKFFLLLFLPVVIKSFQKVEWKQERENNRSNKSLPLYLIVHLEKLIQILSFPLYVVWEKQLNKLLQQVRHKRCRRLLGLKFFFVGLLLPDPGNCWSILVSEHSRWEIGCSAQAEIHRGWGTTTPQEKGRKRKCCDNGYSWA